jgi:hypothetical protein
MRAPLAQRVSGVATTGCGTFTLGSSRQTGSEPLGASRVPIDDRKLCAGDHHRAEPGTTDRRVWSETGCTCLLVTSVRDVLG